MVFEFPELQGIMGQYYAEHDGEDQAVATAIREHYLPRFSDDALPETSAGVIVAIADRIDTLVGIFGVGKKPTGDKDPFALRRAALGIIHIIFDKQLDLDLKPLVVTATQAYADKLSEKNVAEQVLDFFLERLRAYYYEQGVAAEIIAAVMANKPSQPLDFAKRIIAVQKFAELPEAAALAAANKRVGNLLHKSGHKDLLPSIDANLLKEPAEQALADAIEQQQLATAKQMQQGDYTAALCQLATIRPQVDDFFDHVMVMVDDDKLKMNRLSLLAKLRQLFLQVADISLMKT